MKSFKLKRDSAGVIAVDGVMPFAYKTKTATVSVGVDKHWNVVDFKILQNGVFVDGFERQLYYLLDKLTHICVISVPKYGFIDKIKVYAPVDFIFEKDSSSRKLICKDVTGEMTWVIGDSELSGIVDFACKRANQIFRGLGNEE